MADGPAPAPFRPAGVGVTNTLLGVRQMLDPNFTPANAPQNVVGTSAAYGVYMSISSNLRYQVGSGRYREQERQSKGVWGLWVECG